MVKYEIIIQENCSKEEAMSYRLSAAKILSGTGFKLFCYLESFPWGITRYNRKTFTDLMNVAPKTADFAFEELIEKGYLQQQDETSYIFVFSRENL